MVKEGRYEVKREKAGGGTGYEYEFYLYIDSEMVMTATELESYGVQFEDVPNWTTALETFAEAYIEHGSTADAVHTVKDKF